MDNAGRLVGGDGIIIFLENYALIAFSLGLFILLSTDYVTRYDETGIQTIKKGQVIRTVFWDDYEAAYFKYGYRGELIAILSPRELSVAERKKMSLRFMHENHIYTIPFGNVGTKKRIGEIKEIIHFMEKKYCVSFEKSMSRSAHTFE